MMESGETIQNLICFTCRLSLSNKEHPAADSPAEWPDFFLPEYLSLAMEGGPEEYDLNVWFAQPFDIIALEEKAKENGFSVSNSNIAHSTYNESETLEDNYAAQAHRDQFQTDKLIFSRSAEEVAESQADISPEKQVLHLWSPQAFGDGFHPTSALCVEALEELYANKKMAMEIASKPFLDVGTGSGILALAAHHFWKVPVFATDTEEKALETVKNNWTRNKFALAKLQCMHTDDLEAPILNAQQPFGIICANIIQDALLTLLPDMARLQETNGQLFLSGYLETQALRVEEKAKECGYVLYKQTVRDNWVCGWFVKK
jgi:ribosomal protein L11 methyltransferase